MTIEDEIHDLEVDELYEAIHCLISGLSVMLKVFPGKDAEEIFACVVLDSKMPEPIVYFLAKVWMELRPCSSAN